MEGGLEFRELTGLPSELVLALGEVTAHYGQIEHILTMTIKRTAKPQISWDDAFEHVKKLGRKDTRKKVKDFLSRAQLKVRGALSSSMSYSTYGLIRMEVLPIGAMMLSIAAGRLRKDM